MSSSSESSKLKVPAMQQTNNVSGDSSESLPQAYPISETTVTNKRVSTGEEEYSRKFSRELSRISTSLSRISSHIQPPQETDEGLDPYELEWDSDDDPDNPFNWSNTKRWFLTMTIAFMCLSVTISSSIYVCAVPEIMLKWQISQTTSLVGLTLYLVGLAFGPCVAAPLSELFGRKILYLVAFPFCVPLTAGVALSKNIGTVLALRLLAGFFSSGSLAIGGGSLKDMWDDEHITYSMTAFAIAPMMGPVLGPIIGGFVAEHKASMNMNTVGGLRWTMWVNLMFYGAVFFPLLFAPETYKPVILARRLKKRGGQIKKVGNIASLIATVLVVTILKPIKMLIVEPIVLALSIYTAFIFSVLFGFFEAFPLIFRGVYSMSLGDSGLAFLGVGVGLLIGGFIFCLFSRFVLFKRWPDGYIGMKDKEGKPVERTPESALTLCKIGSCTLAPSLFWLAWTSRESVHWMAPIAAGVPFGFSLLMIFLSVMLYFGLSYPAASLASAIAANNILRYLMACSFPLFTIQMLNKLHIDWGVSVFAFIALALAPVPWFFTKWGPRLRKISKFGYAAMEREQQEQEKAEV